MRIDRHTTIDSPRRPDRVGRQGFTIGGTLAFVALMSGSAILLSEGQTERAADTRTALGSILVTQIPFRSSSDDGDGIAVGRVGAELPTGSRIVEVCSDGGAVTTVEEVSRGIRWLSRCWRVHRLSFAPLEERSPR
jgi:hypothetical protein